MTANNLLLRLHDGGSFNFDAIRRWASATERSHGDIFSAGRIFIPINKNLHWALCVVYIQEKVQVLFNRKSFESFCFELTY
jgi:Ulp1 family protease